MSRTNASQGDKSAGEQGGDIASTVAFSYDEGDEGGTYVESSSKVAMEGKTGDVAGKSQGYQHHLVSSYARTEVKGIDIEVLS